MLYISTLSEAERLTRTPLDLPNVNQIENIRHKTPDYMHQKHIKVKWNDTISSLVDKMILKQILIQTCFIVLSMNYIDSYVLFAANLDDFRSIAKRIIPGKLADQLADMASKPSMNYRQENQKHKDGKEKNRREEYKNSDESYSNDSKYDSSKDYNSDDSTFSDSDTYKNPGPLGIENKEQVLQKRYSIRNQFENMDLDELVRRVKEQLEKEYNINNTNGPTDTPKVTSTTEKSNKIEDYYYKDDKLNMDFNKDDNKKSRELKSIKSLPTSKKTIYEAPEYSAINDEQYHHENAKAMESSVTDNAKTVRKLIEQDLNKKVEEYEKLAKDNNGHVKDTVDYNNVNEQNVRGDYEGEVIKDIPEYYEDNEKESARYNEKSIKKVSNNNEKVANEAPEYYQDNVKEPARISKTDVQELMKYNEDTSTIEPTRYHQKIVKEVSNSNDKNEKDMPEYYEDNAKKPVKNVKDLVPYKKPNIKGFIIKEKNITKNLAPTKKLVKYDEETTKDVVEYYDENTKEIQSEPTPIAGDFFKEVNMEKPNDSYEDYVTPIRDDIFDSKEGTTQRNFLPIKPTGVKKFAANNMKYKKSRQKAVADAVMKKVVNDVVTPPTKKRHTPQIKAKTARLWYNDPNIENYDDSAKQAKALAASNTTKKPRINTMFPTRFHVKISSPNYFAKLPAVAEKYNFDEPIPEKDREPENIKHIGNPPALINKKVKI